MLARIRQHLHHAGDFGERVDAVGGLVRDDQDAKMVDVVRLHELQALGRVRLFDESATFLSALFHPSFISTSNQE